MGLLEDLQFKVGCACISELKTPQYRKSTIEQLQKMELRAYTEKEWNDAADYFITHFK